MKTLPGLSSLHEVSHDHLYPWFLRISDVLDVVLLDEEYRVVRNAAET